MFELRNYEAITIIVCTPLERLGFVNGFSTRLGGVSLLPSNDLNLGYFDGDEKANVDENRQRFLSTLSVLDWSLCTVQQIHSGLAHCVEEVLLSKSKLAGDAVYGYRSKILAGVFTADCQPILLVDTFSGAYAAIHAGWRGTLDCIVENTFSTLQQMFKTKAENCYAALGPSASVKHYEVGNEIVEKFYNKFEYASVLFETFGVNKKMHLNVREANKLQLENIGIPTEQIYVSDYCTMEQNDLFFSYRKEKDTGKVGRLLSVIGRK